jgi:hypothetical protein
MPLGPDVMGVSAAFPIVRDKDSYLSGDRILSVNTQVILGKEVANIARS